MAESHISMGTYEWLINPLVYDDPPGHETPFLWMQRPRRGWRIPGGAVEMKNAAMVWNMDGLSWEYHGNIMNTCMKNQTNHGNIVGI